MTIRKTIAAALLSLSVLGSVSLNAYAAENQAVSDDLSVRIVSDKDAYSSSEDVKVDIVVENKDETVNNLRIESVLPDKLKLKDGSLSAERASLAPNETVQLSAVLAAETPQTTTVTAAPATTTTTQATTAQPVDSPKTSDNNNMTYVIAVLLILTAVAFLTLTSRKTRTRVLSLFLCLALTGTFIDLRTVSAAGESIETLSARINISVDNEPCIIEVKVSYNSADGTYELVTGEKQVKINSDKFEYIEKDKSYQTTKLVTGLNGTVSSSDFVKALRLEVYNSRNELFLTDEITPADNWNDEGFVLDLGKNRVRVSAEYKDGSIVTDELCVNNVIKGLEDLVIDYDDNDNDGICNMMEDVIGTDKNNADTDGDRISDYNEVMILLTDPTVKDSDENGVEDGDEDKDKDGLSNAKEFELGTDPLYEDTDLDTLRDNDELTIHHTDPLLADTDKDGLDDNREVELGYDPTVFNQKFRVTAVPGEGEESELVKPSVSIELSGDQVETLSVTKLSDFYFNEDTYGYVGPGYEFEVDGEFDQAVLKFEFDPELLNDPEFEPVIYYFDEENQQLVELETTVEGNTASAVTTHFSKYVLLDKKKLSKVWEEEIKVSNGIIASLLPVDLALVIDGSGSMDWNDSKNIRYEAAKELIDQLNTNDRIAVIGFDNHAKLCSAFTTDKEASKNAVTKTYTDGGTSIYNGIIEANKQYSDNPRLSTKKMIVLTDGIDNDYFDYDPIIEEAKSLGITIYTVGLGSEYSIDETLLKKIAESTGGKYYRASLASGLKDEFEKAKDDIDLSIDTDGDGICDYYENGKIRLGFGRYISTDPENPDSDNDGLEDGEEIIVTVKDGKVEFTYKSDPNDDDTDDDGLLDGKSVDGVAPREQDGQVNRKNGISGLWKYHIDYIKNHEPTHSLPGWYNYSGHKNDDNTGYEGFDVLLDEIDDLADKITDTLDKGEFYIKMELAARLMTISPPAAIIAFKSGLATLVSYIPDPDEVIDVCAELGSAVLNFRSDNSGVIHSQYNQWQSTFGYNNIYDEVFRIGTNGNMRKEKFDFDYDDDDFIFWMWRGNYLNLGAGAEIGFYTRPSSYQSPSDGPISGISNEILDLLTDCTDHYLVKKRYSIPMNIYLYNYTSSSSITNVYAWDPEDNSTASDDQWWACGFNPDYVLNVDANKLVLIGAIDMSSRPSLYDEFKKEMNYNRNADKLEYLYFDDEKNYVFVMWGDNVTKLTPA